MRKKTPASKNPNPVLTDPSSRQLQLKRSLSSIYEVLDRRIQERLYGGFKKLKFILL